MITTNPIFRPMQERAPATAWRLRRRLRDLYPRTQFRVLTKRTNAGAELHVTWTSGPATDQLRPIVALFARTTDEGPGELTLWAAKSGGLALIWPGAQRVVLERTDAGEDRGDDA